MASDRDTAAETEPPPKGLKRHGSTGRINFSDGTGSHAAPQSPIRRFTEPSPVHSPRGSREEHSFQRSQTLKDLHEQSQSSLFRRSSTNSLAGGGLAKGSFGKRGGEQQPANPHGGGGEKKGRGWGFGQVVSRHMWLTDEGDDDKRQKEKPEQQDSKKRWASVKAAVTLGSAGHDHSKPQGMKRSQSYEGGEAGSLERIASRGALEQGGREQRNVGGERSIQVPAVSPRPPTTGLDDLYRNHYLHQGGGSVGISPASIESSSAPVKIFFSGRNAKDEPSEEAEQRQEKGEEGRSHDHVLFGASLGSIGEHQSREQTLHSEIEAEVENSQAEAKSSKKLAGSSAHSLHSRPSDEAVRGEGGDGEETELPNRAGVKESKTEAEPDPFDNQEHPLPGTQAYGMTQVDDDDTIQSTAHPDNGLGPQIKAAWQEWQTKYKGVDAEQYAPSDDGSHGGSSTMVKVRGRRHWSEWLTPPMIHPFSRAHRDINIIVTVAIIYTMLTLPFQLCFNVQFSGGWLTFEFLVDVIFLADVAMNFRTGYVEALKDEVRDGLRIIRPQKIVMRARKVARHYLRTWFCIDLISSLPYDILLLANVGHSTVNIVQFLRLFRLFRLHRLMLAHAELQETWTTTQYEVVEMGVLIFYMVYLAHLGACIFVLIGRLESSPQRWLEQFSWNRAGEPVPLSEAKPMIKYSAALYWSVITVTSVGYGDIYPSTTRAERIFGTFFITVCTIFMGYVGGNIAALLILRGQRASVRREKFSTLHAFISKEDIPEWLATRITVHMTRQWNLQSAEFDEEQMLEDLTDELRMDLLVHWWRRTVVESDLFPHKRSFLIQLLDKCKMEQLSPGSIMCQDAELLRHVYILRSGTLKITKSDDPRGSSPRSVSDSDEASDSDASAERHASIGSPAKRDSETEDPSSSEGPGHFFVEPGTIIGERCLMALLVHKRKHGAAAKKKDRGLKGVRVKNVRMDGTAVCEDECHVMILLISDMFDVLERFPGLVASLKDYIGTQILV